MVFTAVARVAQHERGDVVIEVLSSDGMPGSAAPNTLMESGTLVDTVTSVMRPGGPDPDRFVSPEHRVASLLREIGWVPIEAVVVGAPFGVVRETRFRATVVNHEGSPTESVQVRNDDGELLADLALNGTLTDVLSRSGWTVLGAAGSGWPEDTIAIAPNDWKLVIEQARADRESARREATRRDSIWSTCVREAILDGHSAKELGEVAGVSAQRIYQIRDRRR